MRHALRVESHRIMRLTVAGRVQGVGFRVFVARAARARGLRGWVRNRRDGTVEALVAGTSEAVAALLAAVRSGPPGSRVDSVQTAAVTDSPELRARIGQGFSIAPTV